MCLDSPSPHGCYKTGERSRLIYRPRVQGHLRGDHRGFSWQDYRDLIVRAHLQLGGPIVVIWDSLLRRSTTANIVFTDRDHLVRAVRSGMRRIQRRPQLIDGCLTGTGLPPPH
ncbi:hypothetical protein GCM10010377_67820 [Streptomyces viridiviolaceus]|uniref:Transposase n=1 Tax=Streptomyces viridiviolaceus TaxID=68282 RepID=A0ABW2E7L8_9ACTN|nr:hypothetical protein [Streptomyces viridiviolaceus]GHB67363.1 hypothetical protein GCM10010377_67820 [Streptomyces viridiviolaceus]